MWNVFFDLLQDVSRFPRPPPAIRRASAYFRSQYRAKAGKTGKLIRHTEYKELSLVPVTQAKNRDERLLLRSVLELNITSFHTPDLPHCFLYRYIVRTTLNRIEKMEPVIKEWSPSSWREKKIYQQPTYLDPAALDSALDQVKEYPPLVHVAEIDLLKTELARVARGEKFLLQVYNPHHFSHVHECHA